MTHLQKVRHRAIGRGNQLCTCALVLILHHALKNNLAPCHAHMNAGIFEHTLHNACRTVIAAVDNDHIIAALAVAPQRQARRARLLANQHNLARCNHNNIGDFRVRNRHLIDTCSINHMRLVHTHSHITCQHRHRHQHTAQQHACNLTFYIHCSCSFP